MLLGDTFYTKGFYLVRLHFLINSDRVNHSTFLISRVYRFTLHKRRIIQIREKYIMMNLVITGKPDGYTKTEADSFLANTNMKRQNDVTYDTNYLFVASLRDNLKSRKLKKAQDLEIDIIVQSEFEEYIEQGVFPENKTPKEREKKRRGHSNSNGSFPEITWEPVRENEQAHKELEYFDKNGEVTRRRVVILKNGYYTTKKGIKQKYLQCLDIEENAPRTFRVDRILSLETI